MDLISEARILAMDAHKDQRDDEGKSYFVAHLEPVANIVRAATWDNEIVAAAYLHDILEDTDITYEQLKIRFGERVASLVHEVTHEGTNDSYGYYFPRLKSRDAIMIKLADRLSNISRMGSWDDKRKAQYLRKTRFWRTGY